MKTGISLLFLILSCINVSFATIVTDCLCTNKTDVLPKIILICNDNVVKESDPQYYSCYKEIFTDGAGHSEIYLKTGVWCKGSTLDLRIPDAFEGITYYDISHHGIDTLTPDDLRFDRLHTFDASHNYLDHVEAGLFKYAPHLEKVYLNSNNITALQPGAFSELKDLNLLFLTNNPIRCYYGQIFLPLHFRVKTFTITWDNVEEFDISNMNNVFEFGFSDSQNDQYHALAFGKGVQTPTSFSYRTKYYMKAVFDNVKVFNASGSAVNDVEKIINIMGPSLEVLDVSSNFIGQLDARVFNRFTKLKYLNLSSTNLTNFDFYDFHHRSSLQVVDLSYNNLNAIDFAPSVGVFKNLESMNLMGNKLGDIDFGNPSIFPKLASLQMSLRFNSQATTN